jgi:fatty acid desaturase
MDKSTFLDLGRQMRFEPRFSVNLAVILLDLVLVAAGFACLEAGGVPLFVLSQLLFATVMSHGFALLHESGHGNTSTRPIVNTLTGHYASLFCLLPYFPWMYVHQQHHQWTGNMDRDPSMKQIRNYDPERRVKNGLMEALWRSWVPLLAAVQHLVFWAYPLVQLREGGWNPRVLRSLASVLFVPAAYTALHLAFPAHVRLASFWLAIPLYFMIFELVNFPHHLATKLLSGEQRLPLWEQQAATRSCYYPPVLGEALCMNFNFHTEHHLFPAVPWYHLRRIRGAVKRALGEEYQEIVGFGWNVRYRKESAADVFLSRI